MVLAVNELLSTSTVSNLNSLHDFVFNLFYFENLVNLLRYSSSDLRFSLRRKVFTFANFCELSLTNLLSLDRVVNLHETS